MLRNLAFAVAVYVGPPLPQETPPPIFVFQQPFWINLHHFLYVLGRVEAGMPDIKLRAVAGAIGDQESGLAGLSQEERLTWRECVASYANGLSRLDTVFDDELSSVSNALVRASSSASLAGLGLEQAVADTLESAAPVYRKAWWPKHERANRNKTEELQRLLEQHGRAVLDFVTRAYDEPWPGGGFPVNLSAYSNWAGAYSTRGPLLVVSSLDEGNSGLLGLETIFHEAMHQWDDPMYVKLQAAAKRQTVARIPDNLIHAMIFFTAGEAVRSVVPAHVPYAETNGLWQRNRFAPFKPVLEKDWKPYLEGTGTLDAALDAVIVAFR